MTKRIATPLLLATLLGFVIGTFWLMVVRYVTYRPDEMHYHANFALYINGKRDEFKSLTFYEEVAACSSDQADNPKSRVHMHDGKAGLVHVHAHAVTWGHLFENLRYGLTNRAITTDEGVYVDGQGGKFSFVLNGQPVDTVANRVIKSEDRLLINYGNDDDKVLQQRYNGVSDSAKQANTQEDPAACGGSQSLTVKDRLWRAVGIGQ